MPFFRISSLWDPTSAMRCLSMTTIRSASRRVESRWAMAKVVRPLIRRPSASWIWYSVSVSRLLVASSRISSRGSCRMARAMAIRCRSPPDRV